MRYSTRILLIFNLIPKLGIRNVIRVMFYRFRIAVGIRPRRYTSPLPPDHILSDYKVSSDNHPATMLRVFGYFPLAIENDGPDWRKNPFGSSESPCFREVWTKAIKSVGEADVKDYWELSRLYWLPQLAFRSSKGDLFALARLERWLRSWSVAHEPYLGVAWSCGQEAAIRLMNIALAAHIVNRVTDPSVSLSWLVDCHVKRIRPTLSYAMAQDNNHGSAEAAALFVAGSWKEIDIGYDKDQLTKLARFWLEDRIRTLIQSDGSPCQYSVTYHRANLETFCFVEIWRRLVGAPAFSSVFSERMLAGAWWLYSVIDKSRGDAPNFGSNDGSHLFNLTASEYRDFRPTVNIVALIFDKKLAFPLDVETRARMDVFEIADTDARWPQPCNQKFPDGGNFVLRSGASQIFFNYPSFRFRPVQSDLLHLDLWVSGLNVLRDGGTYRYKSTGFWEAYFPGMASHNTVQFDDRDSMPKVGRFLFGAWPKAHGVSRIHEKDGVCSASAAYRDWLGASHRRSVALSTHTLFVVDNIDGFSDRAVLRWRLVPDAWSWSDGWLVGSSCRIRVSATQAIIRYEIVEGWESRYYSQKSPLSVLEVEVIGPGTLTTELEF